MPFYDLGLQNDLKTDFKTLKRSEKDTKTDEICRFHSKLTTSTHIKSLNLLSVDCENEKIFQFACNEMEVDLIALDLSTRLDFYLKQDYIKNAVKRGIFFEICYTNINQHTLANAREIVKHTRGKNIIISSNARTQLELKQPADIINICYLFGLSNDQALKAITTNCQELLEKVEAKKTLKGIISLKRKEPSSDTVLNKPDSLKSQKI
jgi:ribonuclease P/MRP protein subunit RPP1